MSETTDRILYICGTVIMLALIVAITVGASFGGKRACASSCGPGQMKKYTEQIGVSPEQCECR